MKRIIFCVIMMTGLLMNCSDNDPDTNAITNQWYVFAETQCANPWGEGIGSSETVVIAAVETYLGDLGVTVSETNINSDGQAEACLACTCLSGRNIRVKANVSDAAILLSENFVVE